MANEFNSFVLPDYTTINTLKKMPQLNSASVEFIRFANQNALNGEDGGAGFINGNSNIYIMSMDWFGGFSYTPTNAAAVVANVPEPFITVSGQADEGVFEMLETNNELNTITALIQFVNQINFKGIDLNVESISKFDQHLDLLPKYVSFLELLTFKLHEAGLKFNFVTVPEGPGQNHGSWRNSMVSHVPFDGITLMTYDANNNLGKTASAPLDFITSAINEAKAHFPADKIIVAINNYGYIGKMDNVWTTRVVYQPEAKLTYNLDQILLDDVRDPASHELYSEFTGKFRRHETEQQLFMYFSDQVSIDRKVQHVNSLGIHKFIMWVAGDGSDWFLPIDGNVVVPPVVECPANHHRDTHGNCVPDEIETPEEVVAIGKSELSYFVYPSWWDPENGKYGIDYDVNRDHPSNVGKVFMEFLHFADPVQSIRPFSATVGVGVVDGNQPYWTNDPAKIKNSYSPEFAKKIRDTVSEPYVTLSGRGHWRSSQTASDKNEGNMAWVVSQGNDYIISTADFIIDFVGNVCCYKGLNINVERVDLMNAEQVANWIFMLEYLVDEAHKIGLKVIYTSAMEYATIDSGDGRGYVAQPALNGLFTHSDIYHIPFDNINYMMIDLLWFWGDKREGHLSYEVMKGFLDHTKELDPLFQSRTICQFSNYGMWGYNENFFDENGIAITDEQALTFLNGGDPPATAWQFQILTGPNVDGLMNGDYQSFIFKHERGNDDVRFPAGQYSLEDGFRLPKSDDLVVLLGDGFVNRKDYGLEDGTYGPIGQTVLIYSDEYALNKRVRWVYDNYKLNKFSVWHGGRNMPWITEETERYINNGELIPVPKAAPKCPPKPPSENDLDINKAIFMFGAGVGASFLVFRKDKGLFTKLKDMFE